MSLFGLVVAVVVVVVIVVVVVVGGRGIVEVIWLSWSSLALVVVAMVRSAGVID